MRRKIQSYDPYNSFLSDGEHFVDRNGKPSTWFGLSDRDDVLQLWRLGRDAFQALGDFEDRAEYDSFFEGHLAGIQIFADILNEDYTHLHFENEDGIRGSLTFLTPKASRFLTCSGS